MDGALQNPKVITMGMKVPNGVLNAALYWSSSLIWMLLYLALISNLEKSWFLDSYLSLVYRFGSG
jgi:hypothetical protein